MQRHTVELIDNTRLPHRLDYVVRREPIEVGRLDFRSGIPVRSGGDDRAAELSVHRMGKRTNAFQGSRDAGVYRNGSRIVGNPKSLIFPNDRLQRGGRGAPLLGIGEREIEGSLCLEDG